MAILSIAITVVVNHYVYCSFPEYYFKKIQDLDPHYILLSTEWEAEFAGAYYRQTGLCYGEGLIGYKILISLGICEYLDK